jgi:hypothetical protein
MALSGNVVPDLLHSEVWRVRDVPWPVHRLSRDSRFRLVDLDGTRYEDYVGVLSVAEAKEINAERVKSRLPSLEHYLRQKSEELQSFLDLKGPQTAYVVVHLYEWETGLRD